MQTCPRCSQEHWTVALYGQCSVCLTNQERVARMRPDQEITGKQLASEAIAKAILVLDVHLRVN